ncbi:hypothetical protein C3L33_23256, partial [Rhododendron williamsianum]
MDEGDDHRHSRLSVMDAWLVVFKARLAVNCHRQPSVHVKINGSFLDWTIRLLYTTGVANDNLSNLCCNTMQVKMFYFKLDWNQSSFEADDLLNWPNMFVQRNKLEAKCHKYLLKVPKARSAQMMAERRPNRLHNDVCERLQVEINAMSRRLIRQGLIIKKVREAEKDGFDPRESIRRIKRDPQYASDLEEYFNDLESHRKDIIWEDEQDGEAFELAFSKKKIEARKNWLRHFDPGTYLDQKEKLIKYSDFDDDILLDYLNEDGQSIKPREPTWFIDNIVSSGSPEQRKKQVGASVRGKGKGVASSSRQSRQEREEEIVEESEHDSMEEDNIIWEDEQDGEAIELAFSKKKIEARKNWLRHIQPGTYLDQNEKLIKYSDLFLFLKDDDILLDYLNEAGQSTERSWITKSIMMTPLSILKAAASDNAATPAARKIRNPRTQSTGASRT